MRVLQLFPIPFLFLFIPSSYSGQHFRTLLEPLENSQNSEHREIKVNYNPLLKKSGDNFTSSITGLCKGTCVNSNDSCLQFGGIQNGSCPLGKICCKYGLSCGKGSKDKISYFYSPDFPLNTKDPLDCRFEVNYSHQNICALRIEFQEFIGQPSVKYSQTTKCVKDAVYILNTLNGPNEPICDIRKYSTVLYVNSTSQFPIVLLFVMQSTEGFRWKVKITQIDCQNLTEYWDNPKECGRQLMYESDDVNEAKNDGPSGPVSLGAIPYDLSVNLNDRIEELKHKLITSYIINGKSVESPQEFPWQASIQVNKRHKCGGSLFSNQYVLTASHCLTGKGYSSPENLSVVLGESTLSESSIRLEVETVIFNFHYKTFNSHLNDIALIKLKKKLTFSPKIQPICLPKSDFDTENMMGKISGWGRLVPNASLISPNLQTLDVKILSKDKCREMVKEIVIKAAKRNLSDDEITFLTILGKEKSQLCAIPAKGLSTVCYGDSGGALVTQNEDDGRYYQVGIISYGFGPCSISEDPLPVAYTRVSEYITNKFIQMVISSESEI